MVSDTILRSRRELVQQIMNHITENRDFINFYDHVKVVFTHLGLEYDPKMKAFLASRNWSNPRQKEEYLKEIERFLEEIIK